MGTQIWLISSSKISVVKTDLNFSNTDLEVVSSLVCVSEELGMGFEKDEKIVSTLSKKNFAISSHSS